MGVRLNHPHWNPKESDPLCQQQADEKKYPNRTIRRANLFQSRPPRRHRRELTALGAARQQDLRVWFASNILSAQVVAATAVVAARLNTGDMIELLQHPWPIGVAVRHDDSPPPPDFSLSGTHAASAVTTTSSVRKATFRSRNMLGRASVNAIHAATSA